MVLSSAGLQTDRPGPGQRGLGVQETDDAVIFQTILGLERELAKVCRKVVKSIARNKKINYNRKPNYSCSYNWEYSCNKCK
mgnify:CR=1 FL=1